VPSLRVRAEERAFHSTELPADDRGAAGKPALAAAIAGLRSAILS
jgi:hypothetical protein